MFWVDLTFEWYEDAMVFRVLIFIFLFRTNGKKEHFDENEFYTVMVVFSKVPFWKLQLCSKFLFNNYEAHWQQYLGRNSKAEDFTDMDQDTF